MKDMAVSYKQGWVRIMCASQMICYRERSSPTLLEAQACGQRVCIWDQPSPVVLHPDPQGWIQASHHNACISAVVITWPGAIGLVPQVGQWAVVHAEHSEPVRHIPPCAHRAKPELGDPGCSNARACTGCSAAAHPHTRSTSHNATGDRRTTQRRTAVAVAGGTQGPEIFEQRWTAPCLESALPSPDYGGESKPSLKLCMER